MAKKATKKAKKKVSTPEKAGEQYAFPRDIRCPRCNANDTVATSTQGQIQYRHCIRAICRENFKIIGQKILFTDCKTES